MAFLEIHNVALKGISACVPKYREAIMDIYKWPNAQEFINATGVKYRRVASSEITTSDLCYHAAEKLIADLSWDKDDIDALIFVTQTPDYSLPATSCILQDRLGLSQNCYTLDISLGCSGWVYAMSVLSALMQNGTIKKGLLLAGETAVRLCSPDDKSTYPLFGDAGTATALEFFQDADPVMFSFNTNGKGYDTIICREGERERRRENTTDLSRKYIELDGMGVFSFGISKVPKSVKGLAENFNIDLDKVDLFSFHQANLMMNEMIRKKLKLPADKVPYCMDEFGNTSSASIPLVLVSKEAERLRNQKLSHIACGFGVGLSWGSVYFTTDHLTVPNLIEI